LHQLDIKMRCFMIFLTKVYIEQPLGFYCSWWVWESVSIEDFLIWIETITKGLVWMVYLSSRVWSFSFSKGTLDFSLSASQKENTYVDICRWLVITNDDARGATNLTNIYYISRQSTLDLCDTWVLKWHDLKK